jgi:hypothetical protein
MSDFDKAALIALCTRIQGNATSIPVRVNIDGTWKNLYLSEMPAELAVWWARQFVIRRLVDHEVTPAPESEEAKNKPGESR